MPLVSAALLKNALVEKTAELEQSVSDLGIRQLRQVVERTEHFLPNYVDDEELLAALNKARSALLTFETTAPGWITPTLPPSMVCPPGQEPRYMAARCHGCGGSWQCEPKLPAWADTFFSRNAQVALLRLQEVTTQFRSQWCPGCSRPDDSALRAALQQTKAVQAAGAVQANLAQDYAQTLERAERLLNLEPWTPGTPIPTTTTVPEGGAQLAPGRPFYKHPLFLVGAGVLGAYVLIKVIK